MAIPSFHELPITAKFPPIETRVLSLPNGDTHLISHNTDTGEYLVTVNQEDIRATLLFQVNIVIRELWEAAENTPIDHVPTVWWDR